MKFWKGKTHAALANPATGISTHGISMAMDARLEHGLELSSELRLKVRIKFQRKFQSHALYLLFIHKGRFIDSINIFYR